MLSPSSASLSLQDTLIVTVNNLISAVIIFIPRLLFACLILLLGILVAGWVKTLIKHFLHAISASKIVENSPVERFFAHGEVPFKIEEILGELGRWVVIYLFLITTFSIVGLQSVATLLTQLLDYIPKVISAFIIFILGVIAAGLVESVVKSAVSTIDLATGRLIGKISSYTVVVFTSLAAVSELGIAQFFINTLFIGFVAMLTLGVGLSIGLGAKDVISDILKRWYHREFTKEKTDG